MRRDLSALSAREKTRRGVASFARKVISYSLACSVDFCRFTHRRERDSMTTRRAVVAGLGAAAIVFRFHPATRGWISEAQAAPFDHVPDLDGELVTDPTSVAPFGN